MADAPSRGTTSEEINRLVAQHAKPGARIHLEDVRGHHAVAVGVARQVGVVIDGDVGDFLAAFNAGGHVGASGAVGNYAGYGMTAGTLRITGRAGVGTAAYLQGGSVRAVTSTGACAGLGMAGGDLTVLGDAGELAGAGMTGGEIAILGRATGPVGSGMTGGCIFVKAGTAVDTGSCKAEPLDATASARLMELAAALRVTELDAAAYVRVTASGGAAPAGAPAAPAGAARLWAGKSVFGPTADQGAWQDPLPFAIVAAGPGAGAGVGPPTGALPARAMFGAPGVAALRTPLILDATFLERASPKTWAACARGCSAAGAALQVSAPQLGERREMLRASGVPLVVFATPGHPLTPETCADAALVVLALAARSGAPAVLDEAALPSLVEAVRGTSLYKVPAAVLAPPGRLPSPATLQKLSGARAAAVGLSDGAESAKLPLASLLGLASSVAALDKAPPTYLATDAVSDGVSLACAMAGRSAVVATSLPLRLAAAEETAMDADWKAVGDQLATALRVMWQDAQRAAAAAGVRDPRDLTRDNLRALTFDAAALSGARLAGFDERLPWWVH